MQPNRPVMKLKTNLKLLIDAKGYKTSQVARLSGVPPQRLCDWLSGAQVRNVDQLKKVCEVLGVTLDAILFSDVTDCSSKPNGAANDPQLEEQVFMVRIKRVKE